MSKLKKQRKNYFDCALRNRYKQKSAILKQTQEISQFCKSIGLKINEIILSPDDDCSQLFKYEQKFKYVCEKFLMSQPSFSRLNFKIKLNIDSTSISKRMLLF